MIRLLIVVLLALYNQTAHAEALKAHVVGVSDGDTVTVLDVTKTQFKVRLMGIDAPEKAQPYGDRSKQSLSDLAYNLDLTIEWNKRDRYGRLVGKLSNNEGKDLNLEQIKRGMAWHYKDYLREQSPEDRVLYAKAEESAQAKRLGLWKNSQEVPPWEFRREKRARH